MARPPLDAELADALKSPDVVAWTVPMTADRIGHIRTLMRGAVPLPEVVKRDGRVTIDEIVIAGPADGVSFELLVLRPRDQSEPRPVIFHTHGGGMVSGTRWYSAEILAEWVDTFGVVGVSVEYRLPPEHPYPAAVEDCYAALKWIVTHAAEIGVNPQALLIWGQSAGGGLAAATALLARARGGPNIAHLVLEAPMLDDRNEWPSTFELPGEAIWGRISNLTGWTAYLGDARGRPGVPETASPGRAQDLAGFPATYLHVGQVDTFRDEVLDFAARLSRAGVPVELHLWPGAFHGFQVVAPDSQLARACNECTREYLRRAIGALTSQGSV